MHFPDPSAVPPVLPTARCQWKPPVLIDGNLLPPSLQDEFLLTVCVPSEAAALLGYNSRSQCSALHPHSELQVMPQFPPSGFLMPQFPMSGLPQLPLNCPG